MGTWGTGPFGSDGAQDYLDALSSQSPGQRLETVGSILARAAVPTDRWPSDLWDIEVVAAAAVVASNVNGETFDTDPHRAPLNQWDPIGVAAIAPDEYECLLAPLLSLLHRGASRADVSEFLWHEMEDHFGLHPENLDIDRFGDQLVAWWAAVGSDDRE